MSISERALVFPCSDAELLGLLCTPERSSKVGLLIIVGGPQYRVGSHRQFLLLARAVAQAGFPSLRFDCRGMGDSTGEAQGFEAIAGDIGAALDAFSAACPALERIVLWGLCDAASANLLYRDATRDKRIGGMVLLNPWVRSAQTMAQTRVRHYYGQRLLAREFWLALLAGKVDVLGALLEFLGQLKTVLFKSGRAASQAESFQQRMYRSLSQFSGDIQLILSGNDYTAKEFQLWLDGLEGGKALVQALGARTAHLPEADHTFSRHEWRTAVECLTLEHLKRSEGGG